MKLFLIISTFVSLFSNSYAGPSISGGDCFPVEFRLPNQGLKCSRVANFGEDSILWNCSDEYYLMKVQKIIDDGEFNGCFKVLEVLKEN